MASKIDINIVQLLRSSHRKEVNKGGHLFTKEYKSRSISYLKKSFKGAAYEDIWQDAAANMVVNIQEGIYTPKEGAGMYTYFFFLLKSAAIKETSKYGKGENKEQTFDVEIQAGAEFDPEHIFSMIQFREAFQACLKDHKEPYYTLLRNIYQLGWRLKDFHEELGIETYNNAKVKHHTAKNKLLSCLTKKLKDGK